ESIVNGSAGSTSFYATASGVIIDGFTVQDNTNGNNFGFGVLFGAGTASHQLLNCIIQNNIIGANVQTGTTYSHNLFQNNNNPGPGGGNALYTDQYVAGQTVNNVQIVDNAFTNNTNAGIVLGSNDPAKPHTNINISGNTFTGNGNAVYAQNTNGM